MDEEEEGEEQSASKMVWKSYLYRLQQEAPTPRPIPRVTGTSTHPCLYKPHQYGAEFHGVISRDEADGLLQAGNGCYLVRESQRAPGSYTLSLRFETDVKHYKLYYDGQHFVGEKRFDSVHDLVADGLITLYIEKYAADYIAKMSQESHYEESPYMTLQQQRGGRVSQHHRKSHGTRKQSQRRTAPRTAAEAGGIPYNPPADRSIPYNPPADRRIPHNEAADGGQQQLRHLPTDFSGDKQARSKDDLQSPVEIVDIPDSLSRVDVHKRHEQQQPLADKRKRQGRQLSGEDAALVRQHTTPSAPPLTPQSSQCSTAQWVPPPQAEDVESDNDEIFHESDVQLFEKQHIFKVWTFRGLNWCFLCGNFLWGLVNQGVKCSDCGFIAHKKCSEKIPPDCQPDLKYVTRLFGVDLTTVVKAHNTQVPLIMERCIAEIEARGLAEEGLYRISGLSDDIEMLRVAFDKDGENVDLTANSQPDINTVCGLFKLYLRLLPIPVITYDAYDNFIQASKNDDEEMRLSEMKEAIKQLPPAHYHTLKCIISHLSRVSEHEKQTLMSPANLAIVFGPTLLCSANPDPMARLASSRFENIVVEILICNFNKIFTAKLS